jgi:signal transduction histidine kinase
MKKKHVIKSLSLKFFLLFVGILWASSTAALVIIVAAKWNASQSSVIADIMTKAEFFQKFYNENPADFSNLIEFMDDSDTKVSVFSGYQELKESAFYRNEITEEQYNRLMSGDTLKVEQFKKYRFMPFVGFRAGNKAVLIHPRVSLAGNFKGSALVLFICSCLGSIMTAIAAGLVVRPIKKLTAAAREVSKGNFNITVEPKSSDEIGQLTETFNVMTGELKNMEYLRKDFISSVSHEFKTPITAIQGFAKLIREKQLPREQFEEYADIIISETGRLSNLSTNLLRLSALENQAIHDKFAEFSLDEQIRRVILLLENKWSEKNIDFDLDQNETRYSGNEELMQQVWINLMSNAVKFSYRGGDSINEPIFNKSFRVQG